MTDGGAVQDALTRAAERRAERNRLRSRLDSITKDVEAAAAAVVTAKGGLAEEEKGVEKLESFSPTRIWASLRDTRLTDLDRERAERDRAAYTFAEAEARHAALARDLAAMETELAGYAEVDVEYAAALDAKDAWVRDSGAPGAEELGDIATRQGEAAAREHEIREAIEAAVAAHRLLAHADDLLGRARSWSNWDAFGGGGLLTDMMKYGRLDDATALLRQTNAALEVLSRELADVDLGPVAGADVSGLLQGLDVWFDNIFSDLAVRSRIVSTHDQVRAISHRVAETHRALAAQFNQVGSERAALDERRQQLLVD